MKSAPRVLIFLLSSWLFSMRANAQEIAFPPLGDLGEIPVRAELAFDVTAIRPGVGFTAILSLTHAPLWHTYGADPGDSGLPTKISWTLPKGLTAGEIIWPKPQTFIDRGVTSYGYEGTVRLVIPMKAGQELEPGSAIRVKAEVSWLACKEACLPGKAEFDFALPIAKPEKPDILRLLISALGAFLGGLILNLMPCVLPVLSLKIHTLVRQGGASRAIALKNALAYAFGVITCFWAIAGAIFIFKAAGFAVGWGFQFQEPAFVAVMSVFFFALALNLLGVFDIVAPAVGGTAGGEGFFRAFLGGALTTVTATPCTAPFMGAALGFALSSDIFSAMLVFTFLGAGLAFPVIAISAFPVLTSRIPKAGRWSETLRQFLGFLLLGTVLWFLSIIGAVAGAREVVSTTAALLGTGMAAWIWGRWSDSGVSPRARLSARVMAITIAAACIAFSIVSAKAAPLPERESGTLGVKGETLDLAGTGTGWKPYDPELLESLRAEGKPVFVDFQAAWCLTCKANEAAVLYTEAARTAFDRSGTITLKADWTKADPMVTRALAALGRSSVPVYALYVPGRDKPVLLPEILTLDAVERALSEIR